MNYIKCFVFILLCIHLQAVEQKQFVIVIPSYNNQEWYCINLDTLRAQTYTHWRAVYIDDCSTDVTADLVEHYIQEHQLHDKITLIRNKKRRGMLANLYYVVHTCNNDEIIVQYDGDDWFACDTALQRIANAYNDSNVWMTYGSYSEYPSGCRGCCAPLPQMVIDCCGYREYKWVTSAPRTFYAGLFKRIKKRDLLYQSGFFMVTGDMAYMFPLLEMAAGHVCYIPNVLYVYNVQTPLNDNKLRMQQQLRCENIIRAKEKYEKLIDPPQLIKKSIMSSWFIFF